MSRNDEFTHGGNPEGDDAKIIDFASAKKNKDAISDEHARLHDEAAAINSGFGPAMKPRADQWYRDADSLSNSMSRPLVNPHTGACSLCGSGFFT